MPTLAHLSDLHLGRHERLEQAAEELCASLLEEQVNHVVVTGDLTHNGLAGEFDTFERIFSPFIESGRLTMVPGNHDRRGNDLLDRIMPGDARVQIAHGEGVHIVRLDSTGRHNRSKLAPQGRRLTPDDIEHIGAALESAAPGALAVLALHHHPVPLPGDDLFEHIATWIGLHMHRELHAGGNVLNRILGHCDLVLFGHRHIPRALTPFEGSDRRLSLFNAGCSTRLDQARIFTHLNGRLTGAPRWLSANAPANHDLRSSAGGHRSGLPREAVL